MKQMSDFTDSMQPPKLSVRELVAADTLESGEASDATDEPDEDDNVYLRHNNSTMLRPS
jgi:hypothetical protein